MASSSNTPGSSKTESSTNSAFPNALRETIQSGRRAYRSAGPPLPLLLLSGIVAIGIVLPLAYLILRAAGAGDELWRLLLRPRSALILFNSVALAATVTLSTIALSVPLAWLVVRSDLPGRRLWTGLLVVPLAVPSYVGGFVLIGALGPRGMLQGLLEPLGVARLPEIYGFPGAWLALTLFTYPYVFVVVRAALQGMDPALEEASRSLGQSGWTTFRRITLPQLRPAIAAGGLLVALYTLSDFGAVSLLQFDTFTRVIYVHYQGSFDRHLAAGLALVLVCMTLVILALEHRSRGRAVHHRGPRANRSFARRRVPLGRWRLPALAFCAGVVLLALAMPALTVGYWLLRSVAHTPDFSALPGLAWNSLWVSAAAGFFAVVLAVPVAYLTVRFPRRPIRLFEYAIYLGYGLPGIVIALSLVFFGANVAPLIYQTFFLLIAAYLIRFLPQAYGNARASLLQVHPSLEEASRSLGRSWLGTLRAVTLPLVRGGATAGGILVFVTTLKELPITLLLGPIGFKTLATEIWTSTAEGFFADAAPVILVLLGISLLPTLLFAGKEP